MRVPIVMAVKARELGRRGLVVGDRVGLVGDVSGTPDTLARIVRRYERVNSLRRTADDTDTAERVVVANADQLAIIAAVADPEPNPRIIDRCLVAAFDAGMSALLVLTKADLTTADAMRALYEPLGVTVIETSVMRDGRTRCRSRRAVATRRVSGLKDGVRGAFRCGQVDARECLGACRRSSRGPCQ